MTPSWAPLSRVAGLRYGDSLAAEDRVDGDIPVYGSNGQTGVHDRANTLGPVIVVGRKGSYGKLQFSASPVFAIDTTFFVDSRSTIADLRWLYYVLSTAGLDTLSSDVGVPGLSRNAAHSTLLPLVGARQQRAVADFLDAETARIDALVAKKRRMMDLLGERSNAEIDHAFGGDIRWSIDAVPIGSGDGETVALGHLAEVRSGLTLDAGRSVGPTGVTLPYLRVANVQDGHVDVRDVKEVHVDPATARRVELRAGDVLMTEGGDIDKLGRGAVWTGPIERCLHQNHVFAVRPGSTLDPHYLALLTRTRYARTYFEVTASKTTGIASTSSTKISAFRVPLLTLAEQAQVVARMAATIDRVTTTRESLSAQIGLLQEHRQALITAAVTGELEIPVAA